MASITWPHFNNPQSHKWVDSCRPFFFSAGVGHVSFRYNSVQVLSATFPERLLGMMTPFRGARGPPDGNIRDRTIACTI